MTAAELAQSWVPVPLRARHIVVGDVIAGRDGRPWMVTAADPARGSILTTAQAGTDTIEVASDPDHTISVLVPVPERDALELTAELLGARVLERRTIG